MSFKILSSNRSETNGDNRKRKTSEINRDNLEHAEDTVKPFEESGENGETQPERIKRNTNGRETKPETVLSPFKQWYWKKGGKKYLKNKRSSIKKIPKIISNPNKLMQNPDKIIEKIVNERTKLETLQTKNKRIKKKYAKWKVRSKNYKKQFDLIKNDRRNIEREEKISQERKKKRMINKPHPTTNHRYSGNKLF
jgi:hypothetical protein